jgi:hypothetical protein
MDWWNNGANFELIAEVYRCTLLIQEPYNVDLGDRNSDEFSEMSDRFNLVIDSLYQDVPGTQTTNVQTFESVLNLIFLNFFGNLKRKNWFSLSPLDGRANGRSPKSISISNRKVLMTWKSSSRLCVQPFKTVWLVHSTSSRRDSLSVLSKVWNRGFRLYLLSMRIDGCISFLHSVWFWFNLSAGCGTVGHLQVPPLVQYQRLNWLQKTVTFLAKRAVNASIWTSVAMASTTALMDPMRKDAVSFFDFCVFRYFEFLSFCL